MTVGRIYTLLLIPDSKCNSGRYGRVGIAIVFGNHSFGRKYLFATETLKCYANRTGYPLFLIDLDDDPLVKERCAAYTVV